MDKNAPAHKALEVFGSLEAQPLVEAALRTTPVDAVKAVARLHRPGSLGCRCLWSNMEGATTHAGYAPGVSDFEFMILLRSAITAREANYRCDVVRTNKKERKV